LRDRRTAAFKKYKNVEERYSSFIDGCNLPQASKQVLWEFKEERCANGLKDIVTIGLLSTIINVGEEIGKDLVQITSKDLQGFFSRHSFRSSQELWYRRKIIFFYRWLSRHLSDPKFLMVVYWMDTRHLSRKCSQEARRKRDENLPSPEDTRKMISGAVLLRDKLAVALLADTGCRAETIGASMNMRSINVGQIEFRKGYAIIKGIMGKFDKVTNLLVTESLSYLIKYWNELPEEHKKSPENPLFLCYSKNEFGKRWSYMGLRYMIQKVSKKALGRIVNPHDFRHAKGTRLNKDERISDDAKCKLMAWSSRRMLDRYSHTTFNDAQEEFLQRKGIITVDEKGQKSKMESFILKPKECLVCHHINSATDMICEKCANSLDYERIIKGFTDREESEEELGKFIESREIQKLFKLVYKLERQINERRSNN